MTSRSRVLALGLLLAVGAPVRALAQQPATHTVQQGETLWALAQRYLGDPFLWPQIYRLNTDTVEDPHWIFPGEVLRLVAGEGTRAVPDSASPAAGAPAAGEYDIPAFARRQSSLQTGALRGLEGDGYHRLRPGDFYASIWLTEGVDLLPGRMLGSVTPPQIDYIREGASALQFRQVGVLPPEGVTYATGDTLLVYQRAPGARGYGDLVVPTGLVRVTGQSSRQHLAEVVAVFGAIRQGQEVILARGYAPGPKQAPVAVTDSLQGRVLGLQSVQSLREPMSRLLIDIGGADGVAPGDVFQIVRTPGPRPDAAFSESEVMAEGQVVRVGNKSATLLLTRIVSPSIAAGSTARRIGRLPS